MKMVGIIIIACLLAGVAGGYGIGYFMYTPQITDYVSQVNSLTSEVSTLSQTISNQEAQLLTLESENSKLQADLTSHQGQGTNLESENSKLQLDLASYRVQVTTLQLLTANLQGRLHNILGVTVTQTYQWSYKWKNWQLSLPIPLSIYVEYLERPRLRSPSQWLNMAKDPKDAPYVDQVIRQINNAAIKEGFTEFEKVNFVIAFVQSLLYTVDIETTHYDEYPRYPIETLFDRGGDCEDTSILVAAILDRMGYDVALLHLESARHMAAGVSIAGSYGSYYEYQGKKYFYLETTGKGWQIGQIPPSITDARVSVYPLRG